MYCFESQLAELVRQYKHLYCTSLLQYKDSQRVRNSWKEIAEILGSNENECRKVWRNLRDKFSKAKKRVVRKQSGQAGGHQDLPSLYTSLQWLDPFIKHRETSTNMTESHTEEIETDPEEGTSSTFSTISLADLGSTVLQTPHHAPQSTPQAPPSESVSSHPTVPAPPSTIAASAPRAQKRNTPAPTPHPAPPSTPHPPDAPLSSSETQGLRAQKRKRGGAGSSFQEVLAVLDQRRAEREAALEAGRERRDALLQLMDPCGRYVLHVADFMRGLPSSLLSEFKWKLQNLMHEMEEKASLQNDAEE